MSLSPIFICKKAVQVILEPLSLLVILIIATLLSRKHARLFGWICLALLVMLGYGWGVDTALGRLEQSNRPFEQTYAEAGSPKVSYVVVLGGGQHAGVAPLERLTPASLARLCEGLRLAGALPGSRLVLAGGAVFSEMPEADTMRRAAIELGFDDKRIIVESRSLDTADQARLLRPILRGKVSVLVTSAAHMPRSLMLLSREGLNPLPAPTDYQVFRSEDLRRFAPRAEGIRHAELLTHELLGLAWLKFSGLFQEGRVWGKLGLAAGT